MKLFRFSLLVSLLLVIITSSLAENLDVSISKHHLDFSIRDSIIYSFYLNKPANTTIRFVNVFGGEEIVYEKNKTRDRGWQEVVLHSDSIKDTNYSSGVYFLEITGNTDGKEFNFTSFQKPWGESIDLTSALYDHPSQTVSYTLSTFSMIRVRIGLNDGILFRTLQNWEPINKGDYQLYWDGYDQSGTYLTQIPDPRLTLEGFGLPKTVFYLDNPENPQNKTSTIHLPKNHDQYCLSEMAKKAWTNPGDIAFDVEVEGKSEDLELKVNVPVTPQNDKQLAQIYSKKNELYISLNNNFLTETQDAGLSGEFTIAVPELPKGNHVIMFNYIFQNGAFAIGVKKFTVE